MLLISVGIKRVVAKKRYHAGQASREMFERAGVVLTVISKDIEIYDMQ